MIAVTDLALVLFLGAAACFGTFTLAYQLGYAHGRLRQIDGDDGGPRFDEIDDAPATEVA